MNESRTVTVRMFGLLHTLRRNRGLSPTVDIEVPATGRPAIDIARELDLPLDKIEAIFCNRLARDLHQQIYPGDRVAFVPEGTPGPHRFCLGIHQAGQKTRQHEED